MWFKKKLKKTELQLLIESYGKDKDILLEFARSVQKAHIREILISDIKDYYKAILAQRTPYTALTHMKAIRMFFREHRSQNCLRANEIRDNPLESVELNAKVHFMQKTVKKKVGRPPNVEMIKKVKVLREQGGLTFRQIAAAIGEDVRQAHLWYMASKNMV